LSFSRKFSHLAIVLPGTIRKMSSDVPSAVPILAAGTAGITAGALAFGSAVDTRTLIKMIDAGEDAAGERRGFNGTESSGVKTAHSL